MKPIYIVIVTLRVNKGKSYVYRGIRRKEKRKGKFSVAWSPLLLFRDVERYNCDISWDSFSFSYDMFIILIW